MHQRTYDEAITAAKWNDDAVRAVTAFRDALLPFDGEFVADAIKHTLSNAMQQAGIKQGKIMQAMRLALTGTGAGPDRMLTMENHWKRRNDWASGDGASFDEVSRRLTMSTL